MMMIIIITIRESGSYASQLRRVINSKKGTGEYNLLPERKTLFFLFEFHSKFTFCPNIRLLSLTH